MTLLTQVRMTLMLVCLLAPARATLVCIALALVKALLVPSVLFMTAGLLHVNAAQSRFLLNVNVGLRARLVHWLLRRL